MKTILDTIAEHKRMEVLKRKARRPLEQLMKKALYSRDPLDPSTFFRDDRPNIIAEFKRRSPSGGIFSNITDPVPVVKAYSEGGAAAVSILTDRDFFGGSFRDLENVKESVPGLPLLRKDFMIDTYQVHEAKAYGADIILLIAALLSRHEVKEMTDTARSLGLSVLLEVHEEEEIGKWVPGITIMGVNNRDLRDFSVDIQRSVNLFPKLPEETIRISESGLKAPGDIRQLYETGYRGFLMGERFMTAPEPGSALRVFIESIKTT
ncbi:MAG: indole-3-glycerol phosphate synthase TrpC [Bacteroidales bacterium]|nr:indole-3-glycerol phosphate synthase TrpC [Bacteroidales bacterium]